MKEKKQKIIGFENIIQKPYKKGDRILIPHCNCPNCDIEPEEIIFDGELLYKATRS